jgi:hypothetical protein
MNVDDTRNMIAVSFIKLLDVCIMKLLFALIWKEMKCVKVLTSWSKYPWFTINGCKYK